MKLLIFDMGGVVTHNAPVVPQIAESFGISEDDFYRGADSAPLSSGQSPYSTGDIGALQMGSISTGMFWENFTKRTGITVDGDPWDTFFEPIQNPETYQIIGNLKQAGYRVICGTNTLNAHYNSHVKKGDYDCFDKVYASHLMGVIKPNPDFWRSILKEENIEAADAFFTDDSAENVNAAAKLGFQVHHFTDALDLKKALSDFMRFPKNSI